MCSFFASFFDWFRLTTGEFPALFRRFSPTRANHISSLSSLAADTSSISRCTGLVDARITPDIARCTGLVDSRIHPDPGPDVARGTRLVDSRIPPDIARCTGLVDSRIHPGPSPYVARGTRLVDSRIPPDIACGTGLVDPSVTRVHRTGQRGNHRTDNNNSQHEKPCSSQPVGSIVVHVLFSFLWLILLC
jgi:hypothetical protein